MLCKEISPDIVTYNYLIHGVCKFGEWKEATRLWNEMVSKNIFANVRTFNVLVDSFWKEGLAEDARSIVETMIQRILNLIRLLTICLRR